MNVPFVSRASWIYGLTLSLALLGLYAFGFSNQLVFDDGRFVDGSIFGRYGHLWPLKTRVLSYGTFVWIRELLGEAWLWQRIFNTLLHIATALALARLIEELLLSTRWSDQLHDSPDYARSLRMASQSSAAIWAFHPVAVYGVAYLIQRSIVMATFFTVLALLSWIYSLRKQSWLWMLASAISYILAVLSKEHAITAILLAPLVYVYVSRPSAKRLLLMSAGMVLALLAMAFTISYLFPGYKNLLGEVFDETSRAYAQQLELLAPGISERLYGLSILNQGALFWRYGLSWFLPVPWLLSVDIRPTFPLHYLSIELIGTIFYGLLILAALWVLIKRRDTWSLTALALLVPCALFMTEFATVWLQDPMVLYRSYLWSIAFPLLLAIPLAYLHRKGQIIATLIGCLVLGALSFDRIDSFYDGHSLWTDASHKIDRSAPANAVGRARPFVNLGAEAFSKSDLSEASRLFNIAISLGEPMGAARMNLGVVMQQQKQHLQALENFDLAEKQGFDKAALYFHRGESLFALRQHEQAIANYTKALSLPQQTEAAFMTRVRRAEAAVGHKDFDFAVREYREIIQQKPDAQRYTIGLAMALNGLRDYREALQITSHMIKTRPTPGAYYARALTLANMGDKAGASRDLEIALSAEPNNPAYRHLERQLSGKAPLQKP